MNQSKVALFWFRRDLRLYDNIALSHALNSGYKVLPLFIFDREILTALPDKNDRRVSFIYDEIARLHKELSALGSCMQILYATPGEAFEQILSQFDVAAVYCNQDYEPYARQRDTAIADLLESKGIEFHQFNDHLIFNPTEILKADRTPYTVFTPYMKRWKAQFKPSLADGVASENSYGNFYQCCHCEMPSLDCMWFEHNQYDYPPRDIDIDKIKKYEQQRDYPALNGTSRLSVHLRFGTISVREVVRVAFQHSEIWLNELIWREFYQMILFHYPETIQRAFKSQYDAIEWEQDEKGFMAWTQGKTGYPIVDAGMRELLATGFMHNRVRMITASFLTKHLLIDWRIGEAWFARYLLDYEQASNVGGWQWAASCGTDAAPYFRIFNPILQQEKFDPNFEYIKTWVPEYGTADYPAPIVDHKFARERALARYKQALDRVV